MMLFCPHYQHFRQEVLGRVPGADITALPEVLSIHGIVPELAAGETGEFWCQEVPEGLPAQLCSLFKGAIPGHRCSAWLAGMMLRGPLDRSFEVDVRA
eukprot:2015252-Alexandrium_andersonii.AAC.1